MKTLKALYSLLGLLVIGGYAYATWQGLEVKKTKQGLSAQAMRGRTGGGGVIYYRGGYRGGK